MRLVVLTTSTVSLSPHALISIFTLRYMYAPLTRQSALPCLSREAAASERASSDLLSQNQPANQSPTLHDSPLYITTRHRNPSNRIPPSTLWPQLSRRSTPKFGPTRSRTTSAQPVSRHPSMNEEECLVARGGRIARTRARSSWIEERG